MVGAAMVFWLLLQAVSSCSAKMHLPAWGQKTVQVCLYLLAFCGIAFAIMLGILQRDESLRQWAFSKIMTSMASGKDPVMNQMRCDLLGNVSGVVMEIGTGPGTNFKCWENASINTYIGVEPNRNFEEAIKLEKRAYNLNFQINMLYGSGEDNIVDIGRDSVDAVVATHVLCSVGSDDVIEHILTEIVRVLRPGATFYFFEHVRAPAGSVGSMLQQAVAPLFKIVGNGCQFKEVSKNLEKFSASHRGELELNLEHFEAPMGIPFLRPHVRGTLKKVKRGLFGSRG